MNGNGTVVIKSFKHDGHLHRMWLENWSVPSERVFPGDAAESAKVFVNCHTRIREADGREWVSKIPGVSFFIPDRWYNIVALIAKEGVRYYCNVASPFYFYGSVLTYIDYDLDVILTPKNEVTILDEDEYNRHKKLYHYPPNVECKVQEGLQELLERARQRQAPFDDECVLAYYEMWKERQDKSEE